MLLVTPHANINKLHADYTKSASSSMQLLVDLQEVLDNLVGRYEHVSVKQSLPRLLAEGPRVIARGYSKEHHSKVIVIQMQLEREWQRAYHKIDCGVLAACEETLADQRTWLQHAQPEPLGEKPCDAAVFDRSGTQPVL